MSRSIRFLLAVLVCGGARGLVFAQDAGRPDDSRPAPTADLKSDDDTRAGAADPDDQGPARVFKTDAEWRSQLTYNQYLVTRMKATEPAFSGKYATGHYKGTFLCVCCGAKLFDSRTKFESGTGWPSFWRPITIHALTESLDRSEYEPRVEVTCSRCGAHIGHVFRDGPPPTGLRYCTNSLSLKLEAEPARPAPPTTKEAASNEVHSNAAARGIHRRGGRYQGTSSRYARSASKSSKSEARKVAEPTTDGSP